MPLRAQEQPDLFRLLFEHHPEPMWIYDLETLRFLEVNDAAMQQYGYSRLEFADMDIRGIRPEEELGRLEANLAEARPDLQHSGIWRHRRRDGSVVHVEITSHTLTYAGRTAALVVARDVSERVDAEQRREQLLRETEAARHALEMQTRNFDVMFEQMADPVLLFDADARILRMNHAARAIFANNADVPPGSVSSQQLAERFRMRDEHGVPIPLDDLPVRRVLRGQTLAAAGASDAQVGPRSNPILLSITGAPIRDPHGAIVGAVMISRDVTERRRLERQAQATLRELNQRMEAFLAMAGHEMRTPITSLLGNIQLAARSLDELTAAAAASSVQLGQWKALVARMERQGRLLKRLVNDVLDASAAEVNRLELERSSFDVLAVTDEVIADARAQMPGRSIECQVNSDSPLVVEGDRERIGQVLMHFLANAHKFSPLAAPIQVGVTREVDSVQVWVADHGPGVPTDERERIWERFYRVEGLSHLSGSSVGLGLGLYLGRTIVGRHRGSVGLDSPPAGGATFWFRLPLAAARPSGGVDVPAGDLAKR